MRGFPSIGVQNASRISTESFGGYRDGLKIADGEWNETMNLSSSHYPMLANRGPRGTVRQLIAPGGLLEKDALAYVDNGTLYYNDRPTGLTGLSRGEKQMVSMGAFLCIWPDKVYFNTADFQDYGSMEASFETTGSIRFKACRSDGSEYNRIISSPTEPARGDCDVWIDTSGSSIAMEWSASTGGWVEIPTMFTKLCFTSQGAIPAAFSEMDGVEISGAEIEDVNGDKVIYALGDEDGGNDWIVVVGLLENDLTQESGSVTIRRRVPNLDYVCECQNRLWGCYYGLKDGKTLNEVYCCALGDFKNWRQYLGNSTDSWTASVGSDGVWTGAANYLGHPVFFKENVIHMVTVSTVGAHQIDETICRGVQKGSWRSIQVVNETLYYKSRIDVCAWQGGFPETVSEALGEKKYYDAVAGTFGGKYYISMRDASNVWSMFVYDIARRIWMREDDLHALCFARVDDELYCINAKSGMLLALNNTDGKPEQNVRWEAVSGILHYELPDRKYLSRFNFRVSIESGASFSVYLQYDSDGVWHLGGTVSRAQTGTVTLPIRPRRCDHLRIKISGQGNVRVFSITRILEVGSDQ